ncbi:UDP-N-acetylglucosamine 2-epimerase (non-hydrolyzing), partial [Candidatus Sumerlaeota bacterium]|nr:UDP-N-acetylglucosamine 2-epimerase (non-hydrolyzing) [Candidatus Sumerlaeota bacterium]
MKPKVRILCSVGTRPEAVKMAPVILALKAELWAEVCVLATGQHRRLLDEIFEVFGITPDLDLDIMKPDQSLPELTSRLALTLDSVLTTESPDLVLAQGDTTSVFLTALACFYRKIPFGHVEAGLRTGNRYYPFPEEMNRVLTGRLAMFHFAPTETSRQNLLREGIEDRSIFVTGNTVIDALLRAREMGQGATFPIELRHGHRLILMTAHRRENFGAPFREVCEGAKAVVEAL